MSLPYIQVLIDGPLAGSFSYRCPADGPEPEGHWVTVPWGKGRRTGLALRRHDANTLPDGLKADSIKVLETVRTDLPAPPDGWLAFLRFVARYYHGSLADLAVGNLPKLLRTPPTGRSRKDGHARLAAFTPSAAESISTPPTLNPDQQAVLDALCTSPGRPSVTSSSPAVLTSPGSSAFSAAADSTMRGAPTGPTGPTGPTIPIPTAPATPTRPSAPPPPWLLHGITGSGKTEVYLHWMAQRLDRDPQAQVLMMVPEIGLTPALQEQLRRRFPGQSIAVLHSEMTDAARASHWLAAASGQARIVLGTRLAVLAPIPHLDAIIVDEEHDPSYKQQEGLRYSARDMAVARARLAGIPVLLGSATPSMESWHNAQTGRYRLLSLTRRAHAQAALPTIQMVSLRGAKTQEGLTEESLQAIGETLARGEQALLFLNRRGYAPVLGCDACGWLSRCNRCDAYRVLHRLSAPTRTPAQQTPGRYRLVCHHCATTQTVPRACPSCGNQDLAPLGRGTQKLEDALCTLFPHAHIGRLDRDVARHKGATQAFLEDVHAGRTNLLVGTQMLAKGHDFDRLTLVIVVDADAGLFTTDFRAPERLFATLMQVAGRAGRHRALNARTLIQTRHPEHPLFAALRRHDYPAFARAQLQDREAGALPPYAFQALLQAQARDMDSALAFLQDARDRLQHVQQAASAQPRQHQTRQAANMPGQGTGSRYGVEPSYSAESGRGAGSGCNAETGCNAEAGHTTVPPLPPTSPLPAIHPDAMIEVCDPVPMPLAQVNKVFRAQLLIESSHRASLHALLTDWQTSIGAPQTATGVAGSAGHHHKGVRWQLIIDPQEI